MLVENMRRKIVILIMIMLCVAGLVSCKDKKEKNIEEKVTKEADTEIVVLAAASLTDVTAELKQMYESEHKNVTLTFSYGGSGALMTQIEEGAPADIFMSASNKQMNELVEKKLIKNDDVVKLLENKLVLIVPKNSKLKLESFKDVVRDDVEYIGLGEPTSVPVGQYAKEMFVYMGINDKVTKKAVYGSDVRAVLSYVEVGSVDCGVVYATDAKSSDVKVVCEAPEGSVSKVIYPVGIVSDSKNKKASEEFIKFLQSDEAMKVFEKAGFSKVE